MWVKCSTLFEKPLVSRVKRRIPIRVVRFGRSTYDVEMWALPGPCPRRCRPRRSPARRSPLRQVRVAGLRERVATGITLRDPGGWPRGSGLRLTHSPPFAHPVAVAALQPCLPLIASRSGPLRRPPPPGSRRPSVAFRACGGGGSWWQPLRLSRCCGLALRRLRSCTGQS